jgi:outer membrane receptor protein involved in Fe transport
MTAGGHAIATHQSATVAVDRKLSAAAGLSPGDAWTKGDLFMLKRGSLRFSAPVVLGWLFVLLLSVPLFAQTPLGTISGRVLDASNLAVPGVTVTATSPNLQGSRSTSTSTNGDFILPALPPGRYTVTFELAGFGAVKEERELAATQPLVVDVVMRPAQLSEVVNVQARTDAFANTVQAATNIKAETLAQLPTQRTLLSAVNLAPAVHATGPQNQYSISGSMSYENVFLLNGVNIQDNLRGTPFNLFIEDAIQETTVITSGVSAEYGRFTGGVVNAVTKSGGNTFSGSYRATFQNDDWRSVSPFDEPKNDDVVPIHEFTFGGPILRNRTWFFGAGRVFSSADAQQTGFTNIAYNSEIEEKRFEGKVTQSLGGNHNLRLSYTDNRREEGNRAFPSRTLVMDLQSLTTRSLPQNLWAVHYTGTLGNNFFVEAQYAARKFEFKGDGGLFTDQIKGTVMGNDQTGARWWAPTFCGVCPAEERASDDVLLKSNYFWSTPRGSHNIISGYQTFNDKRRGDNHQSGSDYHLWATDSFIRDGVVYPVLRPDFSSYFIWWPINEASRGTNFRTHSLFVNDTWAYNRHLTFNLGLRWDKNDGKDAIGQKVASGSAVSPRLGLVWDPSGEGRWSMNASYGKYVAGLNNAIADSSSPAGTPAIFAYFYQGPAINATPTAPLVSTEQALTTAFNWFNANGGTSRTPFFVDVPGTGTQIRESLSSPSADEYAVGLSRQLGGRGAVRADFVYRNFNDFYSERVDTSTGQVTNDLGDEFDLNLIENTNELEREYTGLSAQITYRFGARTHLGGNYTISKLWGNINGENVGSGPLTGDILSYPEYFERSWAYPEGSLSADQRHRLRLWANVDLPMPSAVGRVNIGAIQQFQTGTPYGAIGEVRTVDLRANPGYVTPPDTILYFFTDRDEFRTDSMYRTDLAVNYNRRLGLGSSEFFAQAQLLNVFNNFQLFNSRNDDIDTTVVTAVDEPERFQTFNPFTETPQQGVHWDYGEKFGQALGAGAYTLQRTFQFAVGVKF